MKRTSCVEAALRLSLILGLLFVALAKLVWVASGHVHRDVLLATLWGAAGAAELTLGVLLSMERWILRAARWVACGFLGVAIGTALVRLREAGSIPCHCLGQLELTHSSAPMFQGAIITLSAGVWRLRGTMPAAR